MSRARVREVIADLERKGWRVEVGKHYKAYPPDGGPFLVVSKTPGGGRALGNIQAMIRRAERRKS